VYSARLADQGYDVHLRAPEFRAIVDEDLRTGQHRNPTEQPLWFTTAFFHAPQELESEVVEAGFGSCRVLGVEGPGCVLEDVRARLGDPAEREIVLHAARLSEQDPLLLATSHHLLAVAVA